MARKYLGDEFDIHGGAVDLRFPHHENEQAQSRAAGLGFARYWLHNAWLTASGEKMSKSLGNGMTIGEVTKVARALAVRYYLSASHYRSTVEYHPGALAEAEAAVDRIEGFLRRAEPPEGWDATGPAGADPFPAAFRAAMDDDLNVAGALAVVHDSVRAGNTALDEGDDEEAAAAGRRILAMTSTLGINPLDPAWSGSAAAADDDAVEALTALVEERLHARAHARRERDYATADGIREQLAAHGILVEDTPGGARWSLARRTEAAADPGESPADRDDRTIDAASGD